MKNRQTRIIIGALVGLLLFASSLALMFYLKQTQKDVNAADTIEVYVASHDIKRGAFLDANTIKKASIPSSFISTTPLMDSEIIGRYANIDIFKDEPIRVEKIATQKPSEEKEVITFKKEVIESNQLDESNAPLTDTFAMPLSLFKNIDTTLKKGDFVDIVSVSYKTQKNKERSFRTKYVAIHIPIRSFVLGSQEISTYTQTIQKDGKDALAFADTIVLEVSPKEIKNLLGVYYKTQALNEDRVYNIKNYGGQLWIVKSTKKLNTQTLKEKKSMMIDKKTYVKPSKTPIQKVSISYEK